MDKGMDCMSEKEMKGMMKKDMGFYGHMKPPKLSLMRKMSRKKMVKGMGGM